MTLDTKIIISGVDLDPESVFLYAASLLGADDNYQYDIDPETWMTSGYYASVISAKPGQGLPAWLIVSVEPAGLIRISYDTAYGYKMDNGAGCGDLHAWLIAQLALKYAPNATMLWQNEFNGNWQEIIYDYLQNEQDWEWFLDSFEGFGNPRKGALEFGKRLEVA